MVSPAQQGQLVLLNFHSRCTTGIGLGEEGTASHLFGPGSLRTCVGCGRQSSPPRTCGIPCSTLRHSGCQRRSQVPGGNMDQQQDSWKQEPKKVTQGFTRVPVQLQQHSLFLNYKYQCHSVCTSL